MSERSLSIDRCTDKIEIHTRLTYIQDRYDTNIQGRYTNRIDTNIDVQTIVKLHQSRRRCTKDPYQLPVTVHITMSERSFS